MHETEVARFVPATPPVLERTLTPERIVTAEGSFEVLDIEEQDGLTLITAGARGLQLVLHFERTEQGWTYEQAGQAGPFDDMWTHLSWEAENEGARVTATSGVSLGLPLPAISDRIAAWKRRGELQRLLDELAAEFD
ncbi:SRPBCC family protein [Halolamina sp.]|jgi:hypothetical protein|uniref:SRPBCC family protein n=1 Tax=Halolamina sp. TaxID=1940283 RepID=UPI0035652C2B